MARARAVGMTLSRAVRSTVSRVRVLCLVCLASCAVLLLTHSTWRERASKQGDTQRNVVVLCASSFEEEKYKRWFASGALWGARGEPLGRERPWGGHGTKLNLLRERLEDMLAAGRHDDIVLYTDSFDVLFVGAPAEAAARFVSGGARVLFAAERACAPDPELWSRYPRAPGLYRYLNAGAVIGYASSLHALVSLRMVRDDEDDQRYYTGVYLNESLRAALRVRLDHRAEIFQCLVDVTDHVRVVTSASSWAHVENTLTGTRPLLLHGNGYGLTTLWELEQRLVRAWAAQPRLAPRPQRLEALVQLYGLDEDDDVAAAGR